MLLANTVKQVYTLRSLNLLNINTGSLILDLRGNSGGLLSLAEYTVNAIINGAGQLTSQLMYQQRYNDQLPFLNQQIVFSQPDRGLSLSSVVIVIDQYTCSAAEMVINSLKPYIDVQLVGGHRSCGKHFGMNPLEVCEGILFPVTMEMLNARDNNNQRQGFMPSCFIEETWLYEWGDLRDPHIQQALNLATGRSCYGCDAAWVESWP